MKFDKILQRISEQLYGDEKLRSNLTDAEATLVFDWAMHWIEEQAGSTKDEASAKQIAQRALAQTRPVISAINALAARSGEIPLTDAVAALESALKIKVPRPHVFKLLTLLASATWRMQSESAKNNP
jgi:hypothetical protein